METAGHIRPVRSFVLRQGRITAAQRTALNSLWQHYGVECAGSPIDLDQLFGRSAPRVLEIGFGMGDALAEMARAHPEQDFLGIEVHRPGVGNLLRLLAEQQSTNVRVVCADAVEVLQLYFPTTAFDAVHLFFPDPWPKRRHHKRRIVQPDFVTLAAQKLKRGGRLHLCTDWEDYARQMLEVLNATPVLANLSTTGFYTDRGERPLSKFERRATREGREVWDLIFFVR